MEEIWRQAVDCPPGYMVSNFGRVAGSSGKILKLVPDTGGYLMFNVQINGKVRHVRVHRLVAKTFHTIGTNDVVRHRDGNRTNNNADNLRPGSQTQNIADATVEKVKSRIELLEDELKRLRQQEDLLMAVTESGQTGH